jgi:glycerophosphoryl diester phosphodiesterase
MYDRAVSTRQRSSPRPRFSSLQGAACIGFLLLLTACSSTAPAPHLPRAGDACDQKVERQRWERAGIPDQGIRPPLLSAHRGGVTLAPENTLAAYQHAFAYGMDFIEVDVRETADGVFVAMHDDTVDRTTNGTGLVSSLSWAEIQSLNAADFTPWQNSEYDPSPVPRLEQILDLARSARRGVEFDIKSVRNYAAFFDLVAAYDLMSRSFFSLDPASAEAVQSSNPEVRVIFNIDGDEPPETLFEATRHATIFGSRRQRFSPEKIAAIHDGCAFVLPHSYDLGEPAEADEFVRGLADGADGAQVNQPDVIAAAAQRRVTAELVYLQDQHQACLRNAHNGFGLPRQVLRVQSTDRAVNSSELTDRDGCINLPLRSGDLVILHEDNPAVRGAKLRMTPSGSARRF